MKRALLAFLGALVLAAGCAGVQLRDARPVVDVVSKPAHTCTGWRACFAQLWIGVKVPMAQPQPPVVTFQCEHGIVVGVSVEIPRAGRLELAWPPDICERAGGPAPKLST
jgi:hypothetical protein